MLSHLTHVRGADLVGSGVQTELKCMLGIFGMVEAIAVEVVRHVAVVSRNRFLSMLVWKVKKWSSLVDVSLITSNISQGVFSSSVSLLRGLLHEDCWV